MFYILLLKKVDGEWYADDNVRNEKQKKNNHLGE